MKISDLGELLLLASLWGASFLFMRIASPVFGPVWLMECRVLIAGLALLPLVVKLGLLGEVRRYAKPLFIIGCFNAALPYLLFAFASLFLPAGVTSILNATTPLFGSIVAFIWLKEKFTLSKIIGLVLGLGGVVVLVGWQSFVVTPNSLLAVGGVLIATLMYAIAAPYIKKQLSGVPSLVIATGSLLFAPLFLLPAIPFTVPTTAPTPISIMALFGLALLSTSLAYILYFRLISNVGSTKALTVAYLIPIFAMLWGAIFLKEAITVSMILGCSLVLLGTAIANDLFKSMVFKKMF
ncbi:MAG: DMT family transporter [Spirulinaceae cyanobacterium]